jgi:CHAT domain-containing protein
LILSFLWFLLLALSCSLAIEGCRRTSPEATLAGIRDQMQRGQLETAERDANAALAAYQTKSPEWAARFRVVKARIVMMRGNYSDSLHLVDEPLPPALARTDTAVERSMVAGLDYIFLEQFAQADQAITQSEALSEAIHSSLAGAVAQTRGILESFRNNIPAAISAFETAAAFGRQHNLPKMQLDALGELGIIAMKEGHYDQAIDRFRAALATSRAIGAADSEAKTLGNLGWSYWVIGDFENAEAHFKAGYEKAGLVGLTEDQTYWQVATADVEALEHRYADADLTARKALALAEKHDDKETLASCLNVLSRVALATGRIAEAEEFNRRAASLGTQDPSLANSSNLIAGRIALAKHDDRAALDAFEKVLSDPHSDALLKWEAHSRMAEVYASTNQPQKAEHEFDQAVRTVKEARDSIAKPENRVSFLSNSIELFDAYINFLILEHRPEDALKIADLSRAETLAASLSPARDTRSVAAPLRDPQATARRLHATLLFYWLGRQNSWLWVINPDKTSLLPLPPSSKLDALVDSYRDSFSGPEDPLEAGSTDGRELYALLLLPAEPLIPKNSRVVILPDGSLNSLNFETLIVPTPEPHYWIEDATLVTANSLSRLGESTLRPPPKPANLLLMGDAAPASPDFPPLPEARKEVGLLEKYFEPSGRLELTGKQATPGAFLASSPERFAFVHFATHGTASSIRPLESAVILSPEGDSYKLYARDVVEHPLSAYLVTISACNGAGTKTYAGEGLVGLSWAFLRAGAHNVIAGLWEVSNASTPELMDELYRGLHSGQDPATALRNAKLTLVHSSGNYRKPFYWAPFLLYSGS